MMEMIGGAFSINWKSEPFEKKESKQNVTKNALQVYQHIASSMFHYIGKNQLAWRQEEVQVVLRRISSHLS
jgi:hypothetical protein